VDAEAFSRWFLAIFFVVVALFYTVTITIKKHSAGASPVSFGRRGTRHWLIHTTFRVFRVLILLVCLIRLPYPRLDAYLVPITSLWLPAILLFGNTVMLISFVGLIWLHGVMGSHWRSGIPPGEVHPLITTGPFAWSRNTMFLLVQAAQLGFFLSLPSLFTLICLIVGVAAIHAQERLEERHLEATHGTEYARYRERVPRWLSGRRSGRARKKNA
jgi:protein-S-isoprenylcysteine O-methyltransferase Ste14